MRLPNRLESPNNDNLPTKKQMSGSEQARAKEATAALMREKQEKGTVSLTFTETGSHLKNDKKICNFF